MCTLESFELRQPPPPTLSLSLSLSPSLSLSLLLQKNCTVILLPDSFPPPLVYRGYYSCAFVVDVKSGMKMNLVKELAGVKKRKLNCVFWYNC